jgi:hypothetical protein
LGTCVRWTRLKCPTFFPSSIPILPACS